jgi:UDP-2,3-diacylglucosamine hydrolase
MSGPEPVNGIVSADSCIIASDTHFEENGAADERLSLLIEAALTKNCPLFFLGDLVNLWFESHRLAARYSDMFRQLKGGKGFFIPGNRDFLAGRVFHERTGLTVLPEIADVRIGCTPYRLLHGDQIFLGDRNYRIYRMLVRAAPVRSMLRIAPDFLLRALAGILKRDPDIPPEEKEILLNRKRFVRHVYSKDISFYICGHIHRHTEVIENIDEHAVTVRALDSWIHEPEYLFIDTNGMHVSFLKQPAADCKRTLPENC